MLKVVIVLKQLSDTIVKLTINLIRQFICEQFLDIASELVALSSLENGLSFGLH